MAEAVSQLKLLLTSILDILKVFDHIDIVFRPTAAALNSYTHLAWVRFGCSGSLV
jgi:hypothetical protein